MSRMMPIMVMMLRLAVGERDGAQGTDHGQWQREHDGERVQEALELRRQHQVHDDDGQKQRAEQVAEWTRA